MHRDIRINVNDHCYLSELRASDMDALVHWLNEPELFANTLRIPSPYTMDEAKQFLRIVAESTATHGHPVVFAVRDSEDQLIGGFAFEGLTYGHRAEIGYWLAKSYRGRGLMTAVENASCQYAYDQWRLVRITAHVFHFNIASARVLEKCGFQLEGRLPKCHRKGDEFIDSLLYARVR